MNIWLVESIILHLILICTAQLLHPYSSHNVEQGRFRLIYYMHHFFNLCPLNCEGICICVEYGFRRSHGIFTSSQPFHIRRNQRCRLLCVSRCYLHQSFQEAPNILSIGSTAAEPGDYDTLQQRLTAVTGRAPLPPDFLLGMLWLVRFL